MKIHGCRNRNNRSMVRLLAAVLSCGMLFGLAGCGISEGAGKTPAGQGNAMQEIAKDYYLDLTELGMKLTIYLRIQEDGSFRFSNTTGFETDKSAGTVQKTGDEYLMVYSSVNGVDRSISEGITSKFVRLDDGSLDFSVCERIYYGSASAVTQAEDNAAAKLYAYPIPEDYEAPSTESVFTIGTYTANFDGTLSYISFYQDSTYLFFTTYMVGGKTRFLSETGRYGVSTTQLALNPEGGSRVSCEILSQGELSVSVPAAGAEERVLLQFAKTEEQLPLLFTFAGTGTVTGTGERFEAAMKLYADGSFEMVSSGFTESGLLLVNSEDGIYKIYPDHPTEGVRGAGQVTTVPAGTLFYDENGKLVFNDFRLRTSESLSRDKCTLTEE